MTATPPDPQIASAWHDHHRALLDVAYRMLGSISEAEDAVQDAFIRLMRTGTEEVDNLRGWLVVTVSRICVDRLRSAQARRTSYIGPWLPEPIVSTSDGDVADPADRITLDDSVRMALLVVLERLTPAERVAFVLHDVFDLPFDEVAQVVGRSPAAARQLASRARRRVREHGEAARATAVAPASQEAVVERFLAAADGGDISALTELLADDVVLRADGGGVVQAPRRPVTGRDRIAKLIATGVGRVPGLRLAPATVNGAPGAIGLEDGRVIGVMAFTLEGDRIRAIDAVANPDKLP